jgi:GR25 family glycosyltransferase involved in LPS biosynthesis
MTAAAIAIPLVSDFLSSRWFRFLSLLLAIALTLSLLFGSSLSSPSDPDPSAASLSDLLLPYYPRPLTLLPASLRLDASPLPRVIARVINLDRRADRWQQWLKLPEPHRSGFLTRPHQFDRLSAVSPDLPYMRDLMLTGQALATKDYPMDSRIPDLVRLAVLNGARRSHQQLGSAGTIAAVLSHRRAWYDFLSSDPAQFTHLIVFEDDLDLRPFFAPGAMSIAQFVNWRWQEMRGAGIRDEDWDVWLVGFNTLQDCSPWASPQPLETIYKSYLEPGHKCYTKRRWDLLNPFNRQTYYQSQFVDVRLFSGGMAYVVSRRAAQVLVKQAETLEMQVEGFMSLQAQYGRIRIIAFSQFDRALGWDNSWSGGSDVDQPSDELCDLGLSDLAWLQAGKWAISLHIIIVLASILFWLHRSGRVSFHWLRRWRDAELAGLDRAK